MKIKALLTLAATLALTSGAGAQIISQNFNSVPLGNYSGVTGASFGTDAINGNATSNTSNAFVTATSIPAALGRVYGVANGNPAVRSRAVASYSTTTSFSLVFQYATNANNNVGFVSAGWALAAGTDNVSTYNAGKADRVLVGLATTATDDQVTFAAMGGLETRTALTGAPTVSLTDNNWYQLSFNLAYNGTTTFTASSLSLIDKGSDGTGNTSVLSLATADITTGATLGQNLASAGTKEAYAFFATNGARGADYLDNLSAVPEPTTWALLAGSLTALMVFRRRQS